MYTFLKKQQNIENNMENNNNNLNWNMRIGLKYCMNILNKIIDNNNTSKINILKLNQRK